MNSIETDYSLFFSLLLSWMRLIPRPNLEGLCTIRWQPGRDYWMAALNGVVLETWSQLFPYLSLPYIPPPSHANRDTQEACHSQPSLIKEFPGWVSRKERIFGEHKGLYRDSLCLDSSSPSSWCKRIHSKSHLFWEPLLTSEHSTFSPVPALGFEHTCIIASITMYQFFTTNPSPTS